jgi:hypothetical protein
MYLKLLLIKQNLGTIIENKASKIEVISKNVNNEKCAAIMTLFSE